MFFAQFRYAVTTGVVDITKIPHPEVNQFPSVAVLPFSNLTAETDSEHFSDGLTEELMAISVA